MEFQKLFCKYHAYITIENTEANPNIIYAHYLAFGIYLILMLSYPETNGKILEYLKENFKKQEDASMIGEYLLPIRTGNLEPFEKIFKFCELARTDIDGMKELMGLLNKRKYRKFLIIWVRSICENLMNAKKEEKDSNKFDEEYTEEIKQICANCLQCKICEYIPEIQGDAITLTKKEIYPDEGRRFGFPINFYCLNAGSVILLIPREFCKAGYFSIVYDKINENIDPRINMLFAKDYNRAALNNSIIQEQIKNSKTNQDDVKIDSLTKICQYFIDQLGNKLDSSTKNKLKDRIKKTNEFEEIKEVFMDIVKSLGIQLISSKEDESTKVETLVENTEAKKEEGITFIKGICSNCNKERKKVIQRFTSCSKHEPIGMCTKCFKNTEYCT